MNKYWNKKINQATPYVAGEQPKPGQKVIKLNTNENPYPPSPKVAEALRSFDTAELRLYPNTNSDIVRDAVAAVYGLERKNVFVGNGSDEIIDMVGKAFIRQGDNCVGITPTFSVYKFTTLSNGAEFIGVGEGDAKTSLDELAKAIDGKTRVAFICNPNNPTGTYYTESEIRDFLKKVPQNVLVFLDEAYSEFATAADYPNMFSALDEYPNLFINRTFSKIYGLAGLRIGYAIASTEVVRHLWKVKPPFDVNQAAQVAAIAALGDKEHVEATRKMNAEGIDVLTREFTALGFKVLPTQANFICVKIGERARELVSFLERNGMIVRGLTSFGMPEYIRVTIGKPEENEFLVMLVKKWKAEA